MGEAIYLAPDEEIEETYEEKINEECMICFYYGEAKDKYKGRYSPIMPCVIFKERKKTND